MQQRLALAAALVGDPDVLVLDEPMNGLDPAGNVDVRGIVSDLAGMGRTVLLSSHLLAEVETLCSHVVVFHAGRVKACGPAATLPAGRASYSLAAEPIIEARARIEAVLGAGHTSEDGSGRLTVEMGKENVPAVLGALLEARIAVYEIAPRRGDLERFYLELTDPAPEAPGYRESRK